MKSFLFLLALLPTWGMSQSLIPVNVDANQGYTNTLGRKLSSVTLTTPSNGAQQVSVDDTRVYNDCTERALYVKPGESVSVSFGYAGNWMNGYVYVDRNKDNQLTTALGENGIPTAESELLSYAFYSGNDADDASGFNSKGNALTTGARNVLNPPSFTLPSDLQEGEYVIRFKVDWNSIDPAGDLNSANGDFMKNGGAIVDAKLLVTMQDAPRAPRMHFVSNYGFFVGGGTESGLPDLVPNKDLLVKLVTPASCYTAPEEIKVWTVDNDGTPSEPEIVNQTSDGIFTIPVTLMQGGDVWVQAEFAEPATYADTDYCLVFEDEFSGDNHTQPDATRWKRAAHDNNSAWNRFISTSDKVVYLEDGDLVTRCIPCPEEDWEANKNPISPYNYREWMSGAVDTYGLYSFKYGRVDVRSLTNPFTGSFPAIWMLPDDQSAGWPQYGEIDIWEMVNTSKTAHGTIHAQRESQYTSNTACNYDGLYHVFSFEWTETQMKWSVDGKLYSTHDKSSYSTTQINQGFWPFDKPYYIILNQSVGAGGWAANPVDGHIYETRFDFVRVYQTPQQNPQTRVAPLMSDLRNASNVVYDLQGRPAEVKSRGMYISNGRKFVK